MSTAVIFGNEVDTLFTRKAINTPRVLMGMEKMSDDPEARRAQMRSILTADLHVVYPRNVAGLAVVMMVIGLKLPTKVILVGWGPPLEGTHLGNLMRCIEGAGGDPELPENIMNVSSGDLEDHLERLGFRISTNAEAH